MTAHAPIHDGYFTEENSAEVVAARTKTDNARR